MSNRLYIKRTQVYTKIRVSYGIHCVMYTYYTPANNDHGGGGSRTFDFNVFTSTPPNNTLYPTVKVYV